MKRFEDKVAIVTGAGTGIGEAIAHKLAHEGARVVLAGFPQDPVEDVAGNIKAEGHDAVAFEGDLSQEECAKSCVEFAIKTYAQLDILINNAGTLAHMAPTSDFPIEEFDRHMAWNCRSAFLMTKFAIPHLRKTKGCIVSAGSEAGFNGLMKNTTYGGTKAWMHAFMKGVAVEEGKYGVRANCVCPGPIDTMMTRRKHGPMDFKTEKMAVGSTVFGRRGTTEEVANVYAFLASDEASYVTGALWLVDGGITIAHGIPGMEAKSAAKEAPEGELDGELEHGYEGLKGKERVA